MNTEKIMCNLIDKIIRDTDGLLENYEIINMLQEQCELTPKDLWELGYTNLLEEIYLTQEDATKLLQEGDRRNIVIPTEFKFIGYCSFANTYYLKNITFEEGSQLTTIDTGAFYWCSDLESVTFPSSVTTVGECAFKWCKSLKSVTFEEGSQLSYIGAESFNCCHSLTNITIPASVTSIGDSAFSHCENLESVTFEEGSQLTSIGDYAFYYCKSLKEIVLPDSAKSIGYNAFLDCPAKITYASEKKSSFKERIADAKARSEAKDTGKDVKNKDEYSI